MCLNTPSGISADFFRSAFRNVLGMSWKMSLGLTLGLYWRSMSLDMSSGMVVREGILVDGFGYVLGNPFLCRPLSRVLGVSSVILWGPRLWECFWGCICLPSGLWPLSGFTCPFPHYT